MDLTVSIKTDGSQAILSRGWTRLLLSPSSFEGREAVMARREAMVLKIRTGFIAESKM
jgi:hypothetical protein